MYEGDKTESTQSRGKKEQTRTLHIEIIVGENCV